MKLTFKEKSTFAFLLFIFAFVYWLSPLDFLPLTMFDDFAIIFVAVLFWIVFVVTETKTTKKKSKRR